MRLPGQPDCLTVINGPEDGMEFPIVRAPLHIGSDPSCGVQVTLDTTVRPKHALLTVVSDGYRVRKAGAAPVYADGKRVGTILSSIIRSGSVVQVGQTELCLECAADGLARRSRGIVAEGDAAWAFRRGARRLWEACAMLAGYAWLPVRKVFGSWMGILAVLILLYLFWWDFRYYTNYAVRWLINWTLVNLRDIMSG